MRHGVPPLALFALCLIAAAIAVETPGAATYRGAAPRAVLGHSLKGRAITAVRVGDPRSPRKALVVGAIHGDEPAGMSVTRQILRRFRGIRGVDLWVVKTVNPDGLARGIRRNARGVDLNRNFSHRWRPGDPSSGYYPGPRPFSEPESRAVRKLVRRVQPQVSIWFHQPWNQVLAPCRSDASLQRRFSRLSGIPLKRCRGAHLPGTATRWQDHNFGGEAFVVELPGGEIPSRAALRNARAAVKVARDGAGRRARRFGEWRFMRRIGGTKRHIEAHPVATSSALPRPPIRRRLIPFPRKRKREMAAYGLHIRCRHTVGLNHTAIGIEHVGFDDGDVLGNSGQLRASIRLTRYLRRRGRC